MTHLTDRERHVMRHALGLIRGRKVAYRNRYTADGADLALWRGLVARGLAHEWSKLDDELPRFCVRLRGAAAVLLADEALDDEEREFVLRLDEQLRMRAAA